MYLSVLAGPHGVALETKSYTDHTLLMGKSEDPPFIIRPAKAGGRWSVFWVTGQGPTIEIPDFRSEQEAQGWIDIESRAWLEVRKRKAGA